MGLFDELDVASAADDPFGVPDGMYECVVEKAEVVESKEKEYRPGVPKVGLMLTYKVTDGDFSGNNITEYRAIPRPEDPMDLSAEDKRALSFLKMRMLSLGVPEERINSADPEDLVGIDCFVTVKRNEKDGNVYTNVTKVELAGPASDSITF